MATQTANDLLETTGYLVADSRGRIVGTVEGPMYGTGPTAPDALAVRSGRILHHHFIVPTARIEAVDERSHMVGLAVERKALTRFL
jgi:hypothetical protein